MSLQCGIVGLPNVGKSTLFNAITKSSAPAENFPFCTIDPHVGIVNLPDSRLDKLKAIYKPEKVIPATVEFIDIAGLVEGANKGEGLGNKFLGQIRETSAIIHVVRCFDDGNIVHVDGSIDPVRDKEIIDFELQLKDLESIEKNIGALARKAKSGDKDAIRQHEVFEAAKKHLEAGNSIRSLSVDKEKMTLLDEMHLLTAKPVLYLCNVDEASVKDGNSYVEAVKDAVRDEDAEVLILGAAIEADINELETFEERQMFLEDLGLDEPGVSKLIGSAYKLLKLQTYFTAGVKEVRAWTINLGMTAPQAAGVIHTDFEKGFIKAEVIHYNDFIEFGSEAKCKEVGKLNIEGKEYVPEDGDVMHFRFNV